MKRYLNPIFSFLLLLGSVTGLTGCTKDNPVDNGNGNNDGAPSVSSFTASPSSLDVGNPTTLAWSVSGATSVSIDNGLGVQTGTSVITYPSATTTYTLTATNSEGTTTKEVTVTVNGSISRVDVLPSNPQSLQPGGTVQLTAKAYGSSNNDLNLPQSAFTWTTNNTTLAQVSQSGLVTIPTGLTAGGIAQVKASVGGVSSAPVAINVQLQKATTLVIYHPTDEGDKDWSSYTSAFIGQNVDVLFDAPGYTSPTQISLDQIQGYERVFYFTHEDNNLHATTRQLLRLYAQMPNKRLIIMGNSNLFSDDNAFLTMLGVESESWHASNTVSSTFVGGPGTVMEGFTFDFSTAGDYIDEFKLSSTAPALPALMTTRDGEPMIAAIQNNVGVSSKVFFAGFMLENVQLNLQDDFISRLMGL